MPDNKIVDLDRLSRYDTNLKTQANILQRNKSYVLGQFVYKGNIYLRCTTAGTTSQNSVSLNNLNIGDTVSDGTVVWEVFDPFAGTSGSGISEWASSTQYNIGDVVIYGNGIYQCTTAHTSSTIIDDTKFKNLSIGYEKENLYTGTSFNTSTLNVTTSNSMLTKDFLIIKIAYSEDVNTVNMNKSYFVVPVVNEVQDFSYFESTTDYMILYATITDATHITFTFNEAYTIDNFKVLSIDGVTLGSQSSGGGATVIYTGNSYQNTDVSLVTADSSGYDYILINYSLSDDGLSADYTITKMFLPTDTGLIDLGVEIDSTTYISLALSITSSTGMQITFSEFSTLGYYKINKIVGISGGGGSSGSSEITWATQSEVEEMF